MSYILDAMNKIRETASQEYQQRIPEATQDNLAQIGQAFEQYNVLYNEFCDALINRIGMTILETASFDNELAHFKMGEVTSQQDVQEIFVSMAKAEGMYDPEGKNPLGRRSPADVMAAYHRMNRQDVYCATIGDIDFRRNFTNPSTLETFVNAQLQSIYTGDNYDEWLCMKNTLATHSYKKKDGSTVSYFTCEVPKMDGTNNAAAAKQFIKTLKKIGNDFNFVSTEFNAAGAKRKANPSAGLDLFIHKDLMPEIEIEVLMSAFNADKAAIKPRITVLDDFGELTKDGEGNQTYAILAEGGFFRIFDNYYKASSIHNPQGMFTNTFLHHHQTHSTSPFKNAVRFVAK